jgi:toxin ParE1/3/4
MRAVRWEAEARLQFLDTLKYIHAFNAEAAVDFQLEIERKINLLSKVPEMGRTGRVEGSRELILSPNYILVYTLRESTIDLIRFLHTRQQYP